MASIKSRRETERSGEGGRKSSRDTKEERDFLAGGSFHFATAPAHRAHFIFLPSAIILARTNPRIRPGSTSTTHKTRSGVVNLQR